MITHISYECEVCGLRYSNAEAARECEAQLDPPKPPIEIGKRYRNIHYKGRSAVAIAMKLGPGMRFSDDSAIKHEWYVNFDGYIKDSDHYGEMGLFWCAVFNMECWEEVSE